MHKLLERQIRRHLGKDPALSTALADPAWAGLIQAVDEAYAQADLDRALLERSLDLTSQELLERYAQLAEDLAARRQAEERNQRLVHALRSISEAVSITAVDGTIEFVNQAFLDTYGYREDELLGQKIAMLLSPNNPPELYAEIYEVTCRGSWRGEFLNRRKDGSEFPLELATSMVLDTLGQPIAMIGVASDITERKRMEEQMGEAQRMEAVGQLAGGVAHDFNNLLTVIGCCIELMVAEVGDNESLRPRFEAIERATGIGADLVRQLLAFSRRQRLAPKLVNLNTLARDMESLLKRSIREDIELALLLDPDIGLVEIDPGQLEQVILNLMVNARDAMPQGGSIWLETSVRLNPPAAGAVEPHAPPKRSVVLAVSDTGVGMPESVRGRIFEPFFTTKEKGRGTGLGLATVHGIVHQSGGSITCESSPGRGTRFEVLFPEAAEAGSAVKAGPTSRVRASGRTVLLVEDQHDVRVMVRDLLQREGYQVIPAGSGAEALRLASQLGGRLDLLLTDVVMPGMNGRDLALRLLAERPDCRVLFMSGYTDDVLDLNGLANAELMLLAKPFTLTSLLERVAAVLASDSVGLGPDPAEEPAALEM